MTFVNRAGHSSRAMTHIAWTGIQRYIQSGGVCCKLWVSGKSSSVLLQIS